LAGFNEFPLLSFQHHNRHPLLYYDASAAAFLPAFCPPVYPFNAVTGYAITEFNREAVQ